MIDKNGKRKVKFLPTKDYSRLGLLRLGPGIDWYKPIIYATSNERVTWNKKHNSTVRMRH